MSLLQEIELRALVVARDVLGPCEIEDRGARRAEQRSLVAGRQKAGAPVERPAFHALVVAEHDVAGQVLALAPRP